MGLTQEEKEEEGVFRGLSVIDTSGQAQYFTTTDFGPWGDAETKAFYEDLPDLLSLVPLQGI
jgi:hypothetical protein